MLECGDKIGDYTLARFLGRGQFGEVWLAEKELQFSTRKFQHALKFLFKLGDEINLKSAEAEIDTWIEASGHPNVMSVLDMLVHKDYVIIVSEFAEGGSLKSWLGKSGGKAPSYEKALEMMTGILRGIGHLHSRNVVHRDLKPDNILLQGNFPRITDFGISRIVSPGSLSTVAMGSPFYMSPESFDGSKSTQTDIWSAGVILYEMLTGEHPYRSDTIYGLVSAIRQDEPKPMSEEIPPGLRLIVETALQKELSKRFPSAQAMRTAIELETHDLKVRLNSLLASVRTDLTSPAPFDRSAATLEDYETPRNTQVTEVKNATATHPEEKILETSVSEPERSFVKLSQIEWRQGTPMPVVARSGEESETELGADLAVERFGTGSVQFVNEEFGTSRFTPSRGPLLLIAIIGIGLALGLVIGLFAVTKTLFFSGADAPNSASTIGPSAKGASDDPSANAPNGMKYIAGGEFTMGRDAGMVLEEGPAHKVTVGSFYMDVYEVTNEEYANFVKATNHPVPQGWVENNTYSQGRGNFPVVGVDWHDATAFAEWADRRLPREEEWEFAARGSEGRLYPWGSKWEPGFANVENVGKEFVEVGIFKDVSPFGLFDMAGNAMEWTASDFKAYPDGRLSNDYAQKTNLRTVRGGSFDATKDYATTTFRFGYEASGRNYNRIGFRCAKDISK